VDELGNSSRIRRIIKTNQMKYETISQLLRQLKSADISESILKDIELIEKVTLRMAYHDALIRVPFEEWYEATFKTETK
jgi:HEPN domain-containing protein